MPLTRSEQHQPGAQLAMEAARVQADTLRKLANGVASTSGMTPGVALGHPVLQLDTRASVQQPAIGAAHYVSADRKPSAANRTGRPLVPTLLSATASPSPSPTTHIARNEDRHADNDRPRRRQHEAPRMKGSAPVSIVPRRHIQWSPSRDGHGRGKTPTTGIRSISSSSVGKGQAKSPSPSPSHTSTPLHSRASRASRPSRARLGTPGTRVGTPSQVDVSTKEGVEALGGTVAVTPLRTRGPGNNSEGDNRGSRGKQPGNSSMGFTPLRSGNNAITRGRRRGHDDASSPPPSSSVPASVPASVPDPDVDATNKKLRRVQSSQAFETIPGNAGISGPGSISGSRDRPLSPLVAPVVPSAMDSAAAGRALVGGLLNPQSTRNSEITRGDENEIAGLLPGDPRAGLGSGSSSHMAAAALAAKREGGGAGALRVLDRGTGIWTPGGPTSRTSQGTKYQGTDPSGTGAMRAASPGHGHGHGHAGARSLVKTGRKALRTKGRSGTIAGTDGAALEVWASAAEGAAQANDAKRTRLRRAKALASGDARKIAEDRAGASHGGARLGGYRSAATLRGAGMRAIRSNALHGGIGDVSTSGTGGIMRGSVSGALHGGALQRGGSARRLGGVDVPHYE